MKKNKEKKKEDRGSFGGALFNLTDERAEELMNAIVDPIQEGHDSMDKFNGKGWDVVYKEFVRPMAKTHDEECYCAYVFGSVKTQRDMRIDIGGKVKTGLLLAALAGAAGKGNGLAGLAGLFGQNLRHNDEEE